MINEPPKPGKTIVFLEGEILSVQLNQWGFVGILKTKFGKFNYKLKDSISTTNNIVVGMKLIIENGYCYKNKKGEIVVSDGKFGTMKTEIEMNYVLQLDDKIKIFVGKIIDIKDNYNSIIIKFELIFPPFSNFEITIKKVQFNQFLNINEKLDFFVNKIIIMEGEGNLTNFFVSKFELLNENHFLTKIIEIKQGKLETIQYFNKIIHNQIKYINNYYSTFKDILFNMKGEVSKTLLDNLKEMLIAKILDGEVKYPYNILISRENIGQYFNKMDKFARETIYGNSNIENPEELVVYLKYYFPSFKIENF